MSSQYRSDLLLSSQKADLQFFKDRALRPYSCHSGISVNDNLYFQVKSLNYETFFSTSFPVAMTKGTSSL